MRSGPGAARTILLVHIISARPSKQPRMVRNFLKVYMELGSHFLFLQEQIKDIIIDLVTIPEVHTSRQVELRDLKGQNRFERHLHLRLMGTGSPRLFQACLFSTSHPQHVSTASSTSINDSLWCPASPNGSQLHHHGYRC